MGSYHAARSQISFGWDLAADHLTLTGATFSANVISALAGLTAAKYERQEMWVRNGTNAGKVYHVVTNTTTSITLEEQTTGFAATDKVAFTLHGKRPTVTSLFLASDEEQGLPHTKRTLMQKWWHGQGAKPAQTFQLKKEFTSRGLKFDLQHPALLMGILGGIYDTGTDVGGGGGSTLSAAYKRGENIITVASAANYAVSDFIQVGVGTAPPAEGTAEIRKITAIAVNDITLDAPLDYDHASAEVCNEVAAPFTHVQSALDRNPPNMVLEAAFDEATDVVFHWTGGYIGGVTVEGKADGSVTVSLDEAVFLDELQDDAARSTVTALTTQPYQWSHIDGGITFNGIKYASVESWKLTIKRAVDMRWQHTNATSGKPTKGYPAAYEFSFSATVVPQNANFLALVRNGTEFTTTVKYIRTATTDECTFSLTNCNLEEAPHPLPKQKHVEVTATGMAEAVTVTTADSYGHYWLMAT